MPNQADILSVDKNLAEWFEQMCLRSKHSKAFPAGTNYNTRYKSISEYLNKNIHTEVERRSLLLSLFSNEADTNLICYLNNHGSGHVECVIDRATELLKNLECGLTPYEGYLLLVAIHFHDVGINFGRDNHETKAGEIMTRLGVLAGNDEPEKRKILGLAAAHAGNICGDKDKINRLVPSDDLIGKNIRPRLLAAILRFAYELADDRTRASRFLLEDDLLPPGSEIYHAYSNSLTSVIVDSKEIRLSYEIDKKTALKKYKKIKTEVYLLDEIYERTGKIHLEKIYCLRYLRPFICVKNEEIKVTIEVFEDYLQSTEPREKITYTLSEAGYPDTAPAKFCEDMTELKDSENNFMNGEWLKDKLIAGE